MPRAPAQPSISFQARISPEMEKRRRRLQKLFRWTNTEIFEHALSVMESEAKADSKAAA